MRDIVEWYRRAELRLFTSFLVGIVALDTFRSGRRLSHMSGAAARGSIRIVEDPTFPEHDFFRPGREFRCRLRHGSATYPDEATLQVRGAALKFADSEYESPFDLEMNTGETAVFWTLRLFWRWTKMRLKQIRAGEGAVKDPVIAYFNQYPIALQAARDGVRRNPSSFAHLHYYSEFPIHFRARDGARRYVKFRLLPAGGGPESGIADRSELTALWDHEGRQPGDTRPANYLSRELVERVGREGVTYRLQLQLHEWRPSDTVEVFSAIRPWDEATHPWHDLATVELREPLSYRDATRLRFSIGHQPPSLGLIEARSLDDYNSINYARARMAAAKRARALSYRLRGMPPELVEAPVEPRPATATADGAIGL